MSGSWSRRQARALKDDLLVSVQSAVQLIALEGQAAQVSDWTSDPVVLTAVANRERLSKTWDLQPYSFPVQWRTFSYGLCMDFHPDLAGVGRAVPLVESTMRLLSALRISPADVATAREAWALLAAALDPLIAEGPRGVEAVRTALDDHHAGRQPDFTPVRHHAERVAQQLAIVAPLTEQLAAILERIVVAAEPRRDLEAPLYYNCWTLLERPIDVMWHCSARLEGDLVRLSGGKFSIYPEARSLRRMRFREDRDEEYMLQQHPPPPHRPRPALHHVDALAPELDRGGSDAQQVASPRALDR